MSQSPTLARGALAAMLEQARLAAGMQPGAVAAACGINPTTLRRWERGQSGPKPSDVKALAELYGLPQEEIAHWDRLARKAKERGLFEDAKVPTQLKVLVASESSASAIQAIELEYIPGLLQTPEYHQAIQEVELPIDPDTATRMRAVRVQRHHDVFGRKPLPDLEFIIGLAAIHYLDTWPQIRATQIDLLRELAAKPRVSIRVITGPHAAMLGSFTIVTPPSSSLGRPMVYLEAVDGCRYIENPDVVSEYARTLSAVREKTQPIEEYLHGR